MEKGQIIGEVDASRPGAEFMPNRVLAPISGIITNLPVQAGSAVSAATSLAVISKPEDFQIKAEIPERSLYRVRPDCLFFMLDAYPAAFFQGALQL